MQDGRALRQFEMAERCVMQFVKDQPFKRKPEAQPRRRNRHSALLNGADASSRDLNNQIMLSDTADAKNPA